MEFELELPARNLVPGTRVVLGEGALARLPSLLDEIFADRPRFVLADERVAALYGDVLARAGLTGLLRLPEGGEAKRPAVLEQVLRDLVRRGATRDAVLIAAGGGSTGDLAGLTAALLLRGVPWVHVATTLLAAVDAGLGGKCAVDLPEGKNLAGTFHPARLLVVDPSFFETLPAPELRSGFGEIAKYALGFDAELFARLEDLPAAEEPSFAQALVPIAERCLGIKARIVQEDPFERDGGPRMRLNLGHDVAHALEAWAAARGRRLPHGIAVALGLRCEIDGARAAGRLAREEAARAHGLLDRLGLPGRRAEIAPGLAMPDASELEPFLARDKKRRRARRYAVRLEGLGRCRVVAVADT